MLMMKKVTAKLDSLCLALLCLPLRTLRVSLAVQVLIVRLIAIFRPKIILVPIMYRKFNFLLLMIFSTFSEVEMHISGLIGLSASGEIHLN